MVQTMRYLITDSFKCISSSFDYGTDGGAVEFWGISDGNYIHHNWAEENNGFMEVGEDLQIIPLLHTTSRSTIMDSFLSILVGHSQA